jgi:hypothetical protein
MKATDWFKPYDATSAAQELVSRVRQEGLFHDVRNVEDLTALRQEVRRIAGDMDDPGADPPMLWTGIPLPPIVDSLSCDYHLVVSVGGTNTVFGFYRLEGGVLLGLDLETGKEVDGVDELNRIRAVGTMRTPEFSDEVPTGREMMRLIVERFKELLGDRAPLALEQCVGNLLSWGFAHRIVRTGSELVGGLSGRAMPMTKGQGGFDVDLLGQDIGKLFTEAFERQLGWSRPLAVANDTVMALHYFLTPAWRRRTNRQGLFINGTGTNFAMAEQYAVGHRGFISTETDEVRPERVGSHRPLAEGESAVEFFVNYETGSIRMGLTATRFDDETDYPYERNAIAGGRAFPKQFRAFVETFQSAELFERLRDALEHEPGAREVGLVSGTDGSNAAVSAIFPGASLANAEALAIWIIARLVVQRSAQHLAHVLAAVTLRTGFGSGGGGRPDLVAMEGSVWRVPGYPELVEDWWGALVGEPGVQVEFACEPSYNASLPGPLYLAALHRGVAAS